jgi:hypothetical protein
MTNSWLNAFIEINQCPGLPVHQTTHQCTCYADVLKSSLSKILNKFTNKIIQVAMDIAADTLLKIAESEGML